MKKHNLSSNAMRLLLIVSFLCLIQLCKGQSTENLGNESRFSVQLTAEQAVQVLLTKNRLKECKSILSLKDSTNTVMAFKIIRLEDSLIVSQTLSFAKQNQFKRANKNKTIAIICLAFSTALGLVF